MNSAVLPPISFAVKAVPRLLALLSVPFVLAFGGCTGTGVQAPHPEPLPSVSGTITGREPIVLPPNSVLEIRLVDFTPPNARAAVVTEQTLSNPASPPLRVRLEQDTRRRVHIPLRFRLPYDPAAIDPRRDYALEARILVEGRARWTTAEFAPVITRNRPVVVDLQLQAVAAR